MVLMSFVCGRSTAGLCGEWFPYIPLTGFEPSHILLGVPSMILPERFCRFAGSSV
jgi:hypothetical protein